jgi:membrane-associated protein
VEFLATLLDLIIHLDLHLAEVVRDHGSLIYVVLFAIVFAETGLVIMPFLPGDSMLFIVGSLAAVAAPGDMNVHIVVFTLIIAAFSGNMVNYFIGRYLGKHLFVNPKARFFKPQTLEKTHEFYEKWGGIAVIMARFAPFLRTFIPFVAGMGEMGRRKFTLYSAIGGVFWVTSLVYLGYVFGNVPWIKKNIGILAIAIVVLSLLPIVYGVTKAHFDKKQASVKS